MKKIYNNITNNNTICVNNPSIYRSVLYGHAQLVHLRLGQIQNHFGGTTVYPSNHQMTKILHQNLILYQIGQFLELWKNYNIGLEIWKSVVINWWQQYLSPTARLIFRSGSVGDKKHVRLWTTRRLPNPEFEFSQIKAYLTSLFHEHQFANFRIFRSSFCRKSL